MFDTPPDPIAFTIGPISIGWYGLGYAIGLAAVYVLLVWLARRAGEDEDVAGNGIIIVAIAALIGGRLYHVIDQWQLYADNPISIILPPYSGLGVYGGIVTGTLAAWWYTRRRVGCYSICYSQVGAGPGRVILLPEHRVRHAHSVAAPLRAVPRRAPGRVLFDGDGRHTHS